MKVTIRVHGDDRLIAYLEGAPEKVRAEIYQAMEPFAREMRDTARNKVRSRTGGLAASIDAVHFRDGNQVGVRLSSTGTEYAHIQEEGGDIPPHDILPVNAMALAFDYPQAMRKGDLSLAFFGRVHHPGAHIEGQHFIRRTVMDTRARFMDIVRQAIGRGLAK